MTLWAIAYTKDSRGRAREDPYIFSDTIARTRRQAWDAFGPLLERQKSVFGAKAIRVKLEVVP